MSIHRKRDGIHDVTFIDAEGELILRDGKPVPLEDNKFEIKIKPANKKSPSKEKQEKKDEDTSEVKEEDGGEDEEDEVPPPNELLVVLAQGKNISSTTRATAAVTNEHEDDGSIRNISSGRSSNISCIITCNDQIVRSKIIPMTSDPKFDESHKFLVSNPRKFLTLIMEEHDNVLGDTIIAKASIHLRSLLNKDRLDTVSWFELKSLLPSHQQSSASGFMLLGLRWRYNQELEANIRRPAKATTTATGGDDGANLASTKLKPKSKSPSPSRGGGGMFSKFKKTKPEKEEEDANQQHNFNQLKVKIVMARNLPSSKVKLARRNGDSCNPVVTLRLDNSSRRSRVKNKQNDPIYEEEFSFICKPPPPTNEKKSLMSSKTPKWPSLQVVVEDDDKETVNEKLGDIGISFAPSTNRSRSKSREKPPKTPGSGGGVASSTLSSKKEDEDDDWIKQLHKGQLVRKWFKLENVNKVTLLESLGNSIGGLLGGGGGNQSKPHTAEGKGSVGGKGFSGGKGIGGKGGKGGGGKGGKGGGKGGKGGKGGGGISVIQEPEVLLEIEWTYNEDLIEDDNTSKDSLSMMPNEEKLHEVFINIHVYLYDMYINICMFALI
jgi:hypothetical protein